MTNESQPSVHYALCIFKLTAEKIRKQIGTNLRKQIWGRTRLQIEEHISPIRREIHQKVEAVINDR